MGCAPSLEVLGDAPFRPPQGGVRQVALIPVVEQYFPSPDCALFQQLYEAYTDPSVRYYMRAHFDGENGDLSRIPPILNTRAELYQLVMEHIARGMFRTNAEVRAMYATGEHYRIRPILCAVVFLYEGANYVPEGSVQLPPSHGRGPAVFVKVIGVTGDTYTMLHKYGSPLTSFCPSDALRMQTLITKSAGDHNMSRVVLLAAYVYYHQCCEVIGLPRVPSMAASFTCFKTNIPFLCFLREMRERITGVLESPKDSKFYIDEYCLHGSVAQDYVDSMIPGLAHYFVSFINAKAEARTQKQLAHQRRTMEQQGRLSSTNPSLPNTNSSEAQPPEDQRNTFGSRLQSLQNLNDIDAPEAVKLSLALQSAAAAKATADPNSTAPKITYIIKGYLTREHTTLSAYSAAPNEVYVACTSGTVTIVNRRLVDAADGPTHTPALGQLPKVEEIEEERGRKPAVVETIQVKRGDILSFYVPVGASPNNSSAALRDRRKEHTQGPPQHNEETGYLDYDDSSNSSSSSHVGHLRFIDDDGESESSTPSHLVQLLDEKNSRSGTEAEIFAEPRRGSWQVDENIFIESVLLSLVRDECKLAREARPDDPRWVYDPVHNCPVHDGSFYVWHFRRGQENFFYGTVPKFANTNRLQTRNDPAITLAGANASGSGTRVVRGGGGGTRGAHKGGLSHEPPQRGAGAAGEGYLHRGQPFGPMPSLPRHDSAVGAAPHPGMTLQPNAVPFPSYMNAMDAAPRQVSLSAFPAAAQQLQPPSYGASHSSLSAAGSTSLPLNAAAAGQLFLLPNGQWAMAASPSASASNGMLYNLPTPPSSAAGAGTAHLPQFVQPSPPQQRCVPASNFYASPTGFPPAPQPLQRPPSPSQMPSGGFTVLPPPQPSGFNPGYSAGTAVNPSTLPTASAAGGGPSSTIPCIINAQGQLVPLTSFMNKADGPMMHVMSTTSPAAMQSASPQFSNYVMVNGQLCLLQTNPAATAPPSPPQQQQQQQQRQQYFNAVYYTQ